MRQRRHQRQRFALHNLRMETAKANMLVNLVAAVVCLSPTADVQQPAAPTAVQQPAAPTTAQQPAAQTSAQQSAAHSSATASASSRIAVNASQQWVDTNIDLNSGEKVKLTASGEITYPPEGKTLERKFGPEGLPRSFSDVIRQYPVGDA